MVQLDRTYEVAKKPCLNWFNMTRLLKKPVKTDITHFIDITHAKLHCSLEAMKSIVEMLLGILEIVLKS